LSLLYRTLASQYLLETKRNKLNFKSLFFFLFIFTSSVFSEKKYYKYEESIKKVLSNYFENVDTRNPNGMLKDLTPEFFIHYGESAVTRIKSESEFIQLFEAWKNSEKGKFLTTEIESIDIQETHIIRNYTAVADVVFTRKDAKGNEIRTERALYHLIKGEGYYGSPPKFIWGILTKWSRPWKIYMISNIQLD
jgi:hypothetical protein